MAAVPTWHLVHSPSPTVPSSSLSLSHSHPSQLQCLQMHNGAIISNFECEFRIPGFIVVLALTERNQVLFYFKVYSVVMLIGFFGNQHTWWVIAQPSFGVLWKQLSWDLYEAQALRNPESLLHQLHKRWAACPWLMIRYQPRQFPFDLLTFETTCSRCLFYSG